MGGHASRLGADVEINCRVKEVWNDQRTLSGSRKRNHEVVEG